MTMMAAAVMTMAVWSEVVGQSDGIVAVLKYSSRMRAMRNIS
jgi:hypothetical protein